MNLPEFEETWQLTVPDGMKTGVYQLEVTRSMQNYIKYPLEVDLEKKQNIRNYQSILKNIFNLKKIVL